MVKKKAINTCEDGTCRTIVAYYAKGGRSNFAAWNGADRFLMTAVFEEYDEDEPEEILFVEKNECDNMKLVGRFITDHQGYGSANIKMGSHMVKSNKTSDPIKKWGPDICTTMTTFCGLNKLVVEVYDDNE